MEFLFIGYKNGIIEIVRTQDNEIKNIIKNKYEINKILFEDKYFAIIFIGDNKGLRIKQVKQKEKYFEDNYAACPSLCFDKS